MTLEAAMSKLIPNTEAPDFETTDYVGHPISLNQFVGKKNVLLVLNRGFT